MMMMMASSLLRTTLRFVLVVLAVVAILVMTDVHAQQQDTGIGTPIDVVPPSPPPPPVSPQLNVEEICADGVAPYGGIYPFWGTDLRRVADRNLAVAFKQCAGCPPPHNFFPAITGCPRGFVVGYDGLVPFDTTTSLIPPGEEGAGSACTDETCFSWPRPASEYRPGVVYAPIGISIGKPPQRPNL
mmetsp:Transcript_8273/g.18911  ORF Transcript_8273/g.18911 Transcript_8273/m.18911 type:complete len:186 (+) Transcript_8273:221-778(+)